MDPQSLPVNIWAKLITLNPDKNDIHIPYNLDQTLQYDFNQKWRIYQEPNGDFPLIENLSTFNLKINDISLGIHEVTKLYGGERISVDNPEEKSDYVFFLMNTPQPNNDLKRPDKGQNISTNLSANQEDKNKLLKIENSLQEELQCSICIEILHKCVTLTPCQHNFCSSCLLKHLRNFINCPLCKKTIFSITKNSTLSNIIELTLSLFPNLSTKEDQIKPNIELFGDVYKYQEGVFIGIQANIKKDDRQGKMIYDDGKVYEGRWINNLREGKGVMTLQNGDVYEGLWWNDRPPSFVKVKFVNGDLYKGETNGLRKKGRGTFKYINGDAYKGWLEKGVRQGLGRYTWRNGDVYIGKWMLGKRDGFGGMKYGNEKMKTGKWSNDKLIKKETKRKNNKKEKIRSVKIEK